MTNRAGRFRTNLSGEAAYLSFVPAPLPPVPEVAMNEDMVKALVDANKSLASLESISSRIPNIEAQGNRTFVYEEYLEILRKGT